MKVNRICANYTFFLWLCFLVGSSNAWGNEVSGAIAFEWGFIHKAKDGMEQVIDFGKSPQIATGDKLRIYIKPLKNVYVYLYLFDSSKKIFMVFPENIELYDKHNDHLGKDFYFPSREDWFEFADTGGTEKFFLLASSKQLSSLEDITKKFIQDDQNEELKAALLEEINNIRREHSRFTKIAEKGVPITGTLRTRGGTGISGEATLVEADAFYSKTLRLKHD